MNRVFIFVLAALALFPFSFLSPSQTEMDHYSGSIWRESQLFRIDLFSDLDKFMHRLRIHNGIFVDAEAGLQDPSLRETIKATYEKSINTAKIIEILSEGNKKIIKVILEVGLPLFFSSWERVDLEAIPETLLGLFPIEFLPPQAFKFYSTSCVAKCIIARADRRVFKRFSNLFNLVLQDLWYLPEIRASMELRSLLSPFNFDKFKTYQVVEHEVAKTGVSTLNAIFIEPHCTIFDLALDVEFLRTVEFKDFNRSLAHSFFILQSFLHKAIVEGFNDPGFLEILIQKALAIQRIMNVRNADNTDILKICFSYEIFSILSSADPLSIPFRGFFPFGFHLADYSVSVRYLLNAEVEPSEGLLASLGENMLFSLLMMLVNDSRRELDVRIGGLINFVAESFRTKTSILIHLGTSPHFRTNLASFLKIHPQTNFPIFMRIRENRTRNGDLYGISSYLSSDSDFLASMTRKISSIRGFDHLKFKLIFEDAFVSSSNQIPSNSNFFSVALPDISRSTEDFAPDNIDSEYRLVDYHLDNISKGSIIKLNTNSPSTVCSKGPKISCFAAATSAKSAPPYSTETIPQVEKTRSAPVPSIELQFVETFLKALGQAIDNPAIEFNFNISGSSVHGRGILRDSFSTLGRLLSLERFKTVRFLDSIDGIVPLPFTCPRVMAFIGLWMGLCLKNEIPLSWTFASVFRKFLFNPLPEDDPDLDQFIELIYKDHFDAIRLRFEMVSDDPEYVANLPRSFKVHRMFRIPEPYEAPASPFLLENHFLDKVLKLNSVIISKRLASSQQPNLIEYISVMKYHIRKSLLEGRDEFNDHFKLPFKPEFHDRLTFDILDEFIGGSKVNAESVTSALNYTGSASLIVKNDFDSDRASAAEISSNISIPEMMRMFISKLNQDQLDRFVWFVTGSSQTPLGGFSSQQIGYMARPAGNGINLCTARVCFAQFTLVIHNNSARDTFSKFIESIVSSVGFSHAEV